VSKEKKQKKMTRLQGSKGMQPGERTCLAVLPNHDNTGARPRKVEIMEIIIFCRSKRFILFLLRT